jgi:hypothetical protein
MFSAQGLCIFQFSIFPLEMAVSIIRVLKVSECADDSQMNEMVHTW